MNQSPLILTHDSPKFKELELYHTIFGGIQIKISDIIMIFLNFVILAIVGLVTLINIYKKHKRTKIIYEQQITIGQLNNIEDILSKNYSLKSSNQKNSSQKKKNAQKQLKSTKITDEIVCTMCGYAIKASQKE